MDVQNSSDPEGMRVFYYLVQDLKVSFLDLNLDSMAPTT